MPMEIVSKLLGHSRMKITQDSYGKVVEKKISLEMEKLKWLENHFSAMIILVLISNYLRKIIYKSIKITLNKVLNLISNNINFIKYSLPNDIVSSFNLYVLPLLIASTVSVEYAGSFFFSYRILRIWL